MGDSRGVDTRFSLAHLPCRVMNKNAIVNCRWTVRPARSDGQSLPGKDGKEVANMDYVYFEQVRRPPASIGALCPYPHVLGGLREVVATVLESLEGCTRSIGKPVATTKNTPGSKQRF